MASTKLGNKAVGSVVKLNENGAKVEFYVAAHDYESGLNGAGRTLLVRKDCYDTSNFNTTSNAYANSTIDTWFNGTYKGLLEEDIQAAIGTTKFKYTIGGGNSTVSTLERAIFALSVTELGKSTTAANVEGTELEIASVLQVVNKTGGTNVSQWTRTPQKNSSSNVCYLNLSGNLSYLNYVYNFGRRPCFTLPETLLVADDGSVFTNTPPTISSTSGTSGVNLGTKSAAFSFQYTPSDADGDKLTVVEKLDGVVMKTRTNVISGTKLTFECASTAASFQKILNGSHTITIEVSDGQETATFTASFTKAVYAASITLETPLGASGDITLAIMNILGSIPDDAVFTVEATNNAKDTSPVWQDVTSKVKKKQNIIFTNTVAEKGAAFNFRINVKRGSSGTGGYISAVTGAFQ